MKYIIVGLGAFGASLAEKLTQQGNEVIGIDTNMSRVEQYKEKISHTICMDATDEVTVSGLPLYDTDLVIIAIGEHQGANVMSTALFKNLQVKRLFSRAINPLHEKVLQAIGVDEIVHPEEETAERWAKKFYFKNVVDSFKLNKDYSIIEIKMPPQFVGKSIKELNIRQKYNVMILTTIQEATVKTLFSKKRREERVNGLVTGDTVLRADEILVVYGANKDLKAFTAS